MAQSLISFCTISIRYLFYLLLLLVPLIFAGSTFELFEFNKMWLTFGITILVALCWIVKSVTQKRFVLKRTPLDIFILLFLLSQFIATIHSLDTHVSVWGYYSRFNGGLLSLICYAILFFAFVSNLGKKDVKRIIDVSLIAGFAVAIWGLPSHFGYDPTCFVFRGNFDTSCWTSAFAPTIRMFSTLGQPDWLAAYLAVLLPLTLAKAFLLFQNFVKQKSGNTRFYLRFWAYVLLSILFYAEIIWTDSKSGFLGVWVTIVLFLALLFVGQQLNFVKSKLNFKTVVSVVVGFALLTFVIGIPSFGRLQTFTLAGLMNKFSQHQTHSPASNTQAEPASGRPAPASGELGGTDSGKIRLYVWQGAFNIWKANPLFGTGVETFAFAYYKFRPAGHNMTSEWDYLYNKAHNEYLNYLATTGAFGLLTYLLMIGWFLFTIFKRSPSLFAKVGPPAGGQKSEKSKDYLLVSALIAGYVSILTTNFFGFSVVIMNVYLFLIPAFVYFLVLFINDEKTISFGKKLADNNNSSKYSKAIVSVNIWQWTTIAILTFFAGYLIVQLIRFWIADTDYALGYNYDQAAPTQSAAEQGQLYEQAYQKLHQAVSIRGDEPVFWDELSINDAIIAVGLAGQKQTQQAGQVAAEATTVSDKLVAEHPNNVVFLKTRVRLFYTLAQAQPQYINQALDAAKHAQILAPTDAKISYNVGLLYGQAGDTKDAITTLQNTIKLKTDYSDAYYALALIYHEAAVDKSGKVTNQQMQQKAVDTMQALLKLVPNDANAKKALQQWSGLAE